MQQRTMSMSMPPAPPWLNKLMIGLVAFYVLELVAMNAGIDLSPLYLQPVGSGFAPWQPVTRLLFHGRDVFGFLIGLVVLYFAIPMMERLLRPRQWAELFAAVVLSATLLPMIPEQLGVLLAVPRLSWSFAILAPFVVLGLAQPRANVNLMFVLPIEARWFVWGTLFLSALMLLANPITEAAEPIAAWLAVMGWWHLRGPENRKRQLRKKASRVEAELRQFTVHEGGRAQEGRDDWVH